MPRGVGVQVPSRAMRPRDMPILFSWKDRRPMYQQGMLCVPRFYEGHEAFPFSLSTVFPQNGPLCVEFCSGNGEWIANVAALHPECNWVGVEKQFKRTRQIWAKKQNVNLTNLLPICGLAEDVCLHYLRGKKIQKAFVNFPDPWPKNSHEKKRIIRPAFIEMLTEVCADQAELTLVTDDEKYRAQMQSVMGRYPRWRLEEENLPETYGASYFYRLWQQMGRTIYYLRYRRTA